MYVAHHVGFIVIYSIKIACYFQSCWKDNKSNVVSINIFVFCTAIYSFSIIIILSGSFSWYTGLVYGWTHTYFIGVWQCKQIFCWEWQLPACCLIWCLFICLHDFIWSFPQKIIYCSIFFFVSTLGNKVLWVSFFFAYWCGTHCFGVVKLDLHCIDPPWSDSQQMDIVSSFLSFNLSSYLVF